MQSKQEMQAFVINLLQQFIPASYHYHDYRHTLYVQEQVIHIAKEQSCTEEELRLLNTAALWHDTGYINAYRHHEEASCHLAQEHLPGFGFNANEIDTITGMIMATKIPQSPKTKLEEIIADADLVYLGTELAPSGSEHLFEELKSVTPSLSRNEWNDMQIRFLRNHHYFTPYCKLNHVPAKQDYLAKLLNA